MTFRDNDAGKIGLLRVLPNLFFSNYWFRCKAVKLWEEPVSGSPILVLGLTFFPHRFIFRTGLKGLLQSHSQIANQREALANDAWHYLPTREAMTMERSLKTGLGTPLEKKLTQGIDGDRGSYLWLHVCPVMSACRDLCENWPAILPGLKPWKSVLIKDGENYFVVILIHKVLFPV